MLKKLLRAARQKRDRHVARHRPTGFRFAIADSIAFLDGAAWDRLTGSSSVFLQRPWLEALEAAPPDGLVPRYAMIYRDGRPIAVVAAQIVSLPATRLRPTPKSRAQAALMKPLAAMRQRVLVCGNLLSWGQHGAAWDESAKPEEVWTAVAEALYRIRRADRLLGETDLVLVKDFTPKDLGGDALVPFSYRAVETEPDMVLTIPPSWKTFEDYLAGLTSSYRKTARRIASDVEKAGYVLEPLADLRVDADRIHELYLQVQAEAHVRPVTISPRFLPTLAERLGTGYRCIVLRRAGRIDGFVTSLGAGEHAVGHLIGFDRAANREAPLYFRLLQAVIADGIAHGATRLSFGRTALEPKARLGAKPIPMKVYTRHRVQALNVLLRELLRGVRHDEAPERSPFK